MSVAFGTMGAIALFAGQTAPRNWAFCGGQELAINSSPALFALLGTHHGGNGTNTFALPLMEDIGKCHHMICTQGNFNFGEKLPFIEASDDAYIGFITKGNEDIGGSWLLCDGRELPIAEHQDLYGLIGCDWGGDNNTKFNLPNLNGLGDSKYIIRVSGNYPS